MKKSQASLIRQHIKHNNFVHRHIQASHLVVSPRISTIEQQLVESDMHTKGTTATVLHKDMPVDN